MAGSVEFGNHGDAAVPRIAENLLVIRFRIIRIHADTAIGLRLQAPHLLQVPIGKLVMRAERGQFGQRRNLHAPRFVVAKVEMQQVELVSGHDVQHLEHIFLAAEIAHDIKHKSAKTKIRPVFEDHIFRTLRKFAQRDLGVKGAVFVVGLHGSRASSIQADFVPTGRVYRRTNVPANTLHCGNNIRYRGLIRSRKPGSVRLRTFMRQELVADR